MLVEVAVAAHNERKSQAVLTKEELAFIAITEKARIKTVENFMDRIMRDESAEEAARLLKLIAQQDMEAPSSVNLLTFYTGMKHALSEADFRGIGDAAELPRASAIATRRERHKQFIQYRELFELELKLTRRMRRAAMAVGENWSDLPTYLSDMPLGLRPRLILRWAGISYRLGIPGAMDFCDAAATSLMRAALTPNGTFA